jgi:pimeloyl-ACP methyl ester carboxylesterase
MAGRIWRALCAGLLLVVAAPAFADAESGQVSLATLEARYRLPESRFVEFDGARVHYVEEGRADAPVVLLLHGSYYSLQDWADWSKALAGDFRVIRMDRLRFGLTRGFPDGVVSYPREADLVEGFARALGLERFGLAGASSGGIVAAMVAERNPDKVSRLVLFNFPLGHARIAGNAELQRMSRENMARGWQTQDFTRIQLRDGLVNHDFIRPALVARMTDFANREDPDGAARLAFGRAAAFGEAERRAMLARLKMPVLVMWSAENRTLPVADGEAAFAAIGSAEKRFTLVEGIGHSAPIEGGAVTGDAARTFFAGGWPPARLKGQ